MAQTTPQDIASQAGAQSPDAATQEQGESQALLVIEVTVAADGSITVEKETGAQESSEESGGAPEVQEEPGAVTVKDGDEAGELVKHMIAQATKTQTNAQNISQQAQGYQGL